MKTGRVAMVDSSGDGLIAGATCSRSRTLARLEPTRSVRVSIRVGEEFPIDKGASGKVLLAFTETQDPRWSEVREAL